MISVVIPAYNCERYIRQAVESALKQNVKTDMEILLSMTVPQTGQNMQYRN